MMKVSFFPALSDSELSSDSASERLRDSSSTGSTTLFDIADDAFAAL